MEYIFVVIFVLFTIYKFYKNRQLFKEMNKKEWSQYAASIIVAITIAYMVILGGAKLLDVWAVERGIQLYKIVVTIIGLLCASYFLDKLIPAKIRAFYD